MKPDEKQAAEMIREIPGIANTSAPGHHFRDRHDMGRFPTDAQIFLVAAGICPGNNESAKKRRSGKIRERELPAS